MESEPGGGATPPQEPSAPLPAYIIEEARSGRSRCKTCRRPIAKGALRLGVLVEGPYGEGHMWHHLTCAMRRMPEQVEEAYTLEAWRAAKHPPTSVPDLETLRGQQAKAAERKQERRTIPYVEVAPSGRSRCQHCGEPIAEGSIRVILGRKVEFGNQVRIGPIKVHPRCVAEALEAEDSGTEAAELGPGLRANSQGVEPSRIEAVLQEAGLAG